MLSLLIRSWVREAAEKQEERKSPAEDVVMADEEGPGKAAAAQQALGKWDIQEIWERNESAKNADDLLSGY